MAGEDYGEFGGRLIFQSAGKTAAPLVLKQGNVRLIFPFEGAVYYIEGLAQMARSRGALYKLTGPAPAFGFTAPANYVMHPKRFEWQTTPALSPQAGFYHLAQFAARSNRAKTFWGGLYPNSVAVFEDLA